MRIFTVLILSVVLLSVCIGVLGCAGQGHTSAELRRERIRTFESDRQAMYDDLERTLMIDKPSRLSNKSVR
jgi:hypothetical protein